MKRRFLDVLAWLPVLGACACAALAAEMGIRNHPEAFFGLYAAGLALLVVTYFVGRWRKRL